MLTSYGDYAIFLLRARKKKLLPVMVSRNVIDVKQVTWRCIMHYIVDKKNFNQCSLNLCYLIHNNNVERVLAQFKKAKIYTQGGYCFEEVVAFCNNLRNLHEIMSRWLITDRDSSWPLKKNDCQTDLLQGNLKIQSKCCISEKNAVRALTKIDKNGLLKYEGVFFVVPRDQKKGIKKIITSHINKLQNLEGSYEASFWDQENSILPGFGPFLPADKTIYPLMAYKNVLDGLNNPFYTPTYRETISVVQGGVCSKYLKLESLKAELGCLTTLSVNNFFSDCSFDIAYLLNEKFLLQTSNSSSFKNRFVKTIISSITVAGIEHACGMNGIAVSKSLNSALTAAVRAALHISEASICLVKKNQEEKEIFTKLNSDLFEETERLLVKLSVSYLQTKKIKALISSHP